MPLKPMDCILTSAKVSRAETLDSLKVVVFTNPMFLSYMSFYMLPGSSCWFTVSQKEVTVNPF